MRNFQVSPVLLVTALLLTSAVCSGLNRFDQLVIFIFSISPFAVAWMVYRVLRFGLFTGTDLKDNQEFGYSTGFQQNAVRASDAKS
ncbi:MAG: hypothetical protein EOO05_09670 [Chitinophagaceae bacterium]|nr:MAG: hypothetical protein EOO05_09670 [Chitinophagaceae bacterium]